MCLTVYFDGQFWVGVFEEQREGRLVVARHVFGPEPSCQEILLLVQQVLPHLLDRNGPIETAPAPGGGPRGANPKRLAREAARALGARGISTRSQDAIRRQLDQGKAETRKSDREDRDQDRARRREIAKSKARKRHRGH